MKVGLGQRFEKTDIDLVGYDQIWDIVKKIQITGSKPAGAGTLRDPYRPLGINDWYWLSQDQIRQNAIYVQVGDRLIARWGHSAKGLKNYSSDVTGIEESLLTAAAPRDAINAVKKTGDEFDSEHAIPTMGATIYTRKAMRVNLPPQQAARNARQLLWGMDTPPSASELANTICGLLICESNPMRTQTNGSVIFLTTLMLMDLIEAKISYGRNNQFYSWDSMLMHGDPNNTELKDDPDSQKKIRVSTPISAPPKIEGRSGNGGSVAKHPMAGAGTVKLGKGLDNTADDNQARNRVVSISVAWLANYLSELDSEGHWQYFFLRQDDKSWTRASKKIASDKGLKQAVERAFKVRAVTSGILLTGEKQEKIAYLSTADF